jgi:hypothetical protein
MTTTNTAELEDYDPENPEGAPVAPMVDAFTAAADIPTLFGAPLKPYTRRRYAAAQSMGLLWPYIGEEGLRQYELIRQYPGMIKDAAIVCWVCTIPHATEATAEDVRRGTFTVERAALNPLAAFERCFSWAEENGLLDPEDPRYAAAHVAFGKIVAPVEQSKFEVSLDKTGGQSTEAIDPKHSPSTPRPNI